MKYIGGLIMPRKTKEQKELENLNMSSNTVQKDAKMSSNISFSFKT